MGRRADRSVCHLSVVSDSTAAGDDRPCDVSATPADGEFHDYRLALPWDGVEGACRLVAPISITMVAFVFIQYGRDLKNHRQLRAAVLCFAVISFVAAGVAGFCGAMINKYAPVQGGHTIQLSQGKEK